MKTQNTPENPAITRALAVLRASLGIVQNAPQAQPAPVEAAPSPAPAKRATKAVAQAKPAPQPAHDVWFYFNQQRARAERRAT